MQAAVQQKEPRAQIAGRRSLSLQPTLPAPCSSYCGGRSPWYAEGVLFPSRVGRPPRKLHLCKCQPSGEQQTQDADPQGAEAALPNAHAAHGVQVARERHREHHLVLIRIASASLGVQLVKSRPGELGFVQLKGEAQAISAPKAASQVSDGPVLALFPPIVNTLKHQQPSGHWKGIHGQLFQRWYGPAAWAGLMAHPHGAGGVGDLRGKTIGSAAIAPTPPS